MYSSTVVIWYAAGFAAISSGDASAFPTAENSAAIASLMDITPPDDIDMDIRNAMNAMTIPNTTMTANLLFFLEISLSSSGTGASMSLFRPL